MVKSNSYDKYSIKSKLFDKKVRIKGKRDFPVFKNNKGLIYFDSSATTQKPAFVLNNYLNYYKEYNSNIHRGMYELSEISSLIYDYSRENIANYFNVNSKEIVFTKGVTDGLNQISRMIEQKCQLEDEIVIFIDQHHSNLIEWQKLAERRGMNLRYYYLSDSFEVDINNLLDIVNRRTKLIVFSHVSNVTGKIHDVKKIIKSVNDYTSVFQRRVYSIVDGAQAVAHLEIDLTDLNVDFYAFSGHKMYAPFATGAYYMKEELSNELFPELYGGDAIEDVGEYSVKYLDYPQKFEPGTQNIAGNYALSCAIDYIKAIKNNNKLKNEMEIFYYLYNELLKLEGINIIGNKKNKIPLLTFSHNKIHSHDLAYYLSVNKIAVRSGMHCAYPFYAKYKIKPSVRISIGCYNTMKEARILIKKIKEAIKKLNDD